MVLPAASPATFQARTMEPEAPVNMILAGPAPGAAPRMSPVKAAGGAKRGQLESMWVASSLRRRSRLALHAAPGGPGSRQGGNSLDNASSALTRSSPPFPTRRLHRSGQEPGRRSGAAPVHLRVRRERGQDQDRPFQLLVRELCPWSGSGGPICQLQPLAGHASRLHELQLRIFIHAGPTRSWPSRR